MAGCLEGEERSLLPRDRRLLVLKRQYWWWKGVHQAGGPSLSRCLDDVWLYSLLRQGIQSVLFFVVIRVRCFHVVRHLIPFTLSMNQPQHHISSILSPFQLQLHIPRLLRNLHRIPTNFIVEHTKEMTLLLIISLFVLLHRI